MGFGGITLLYDFGFVGYIISIIYIIILFIIHKKTNKENIISYIIFFIYYLLIILWGLNGNSDFYFLPFYNFLFPIPLLISIITEIILYIKQKNNIKNEESKIESINGNNEKIRTTKFLYEKIYLVVIIVFVLFQIFSGKIEYWWELYGKEFVDLKKANVLLSSENYSKAIDILLKYEYDDKVKQKIDDLGYDEIKKLYENKKYEKCIELTDLLDKIKKEGKYRDIVVYDEFSIKSYLELYNIAKQNNDYEKLVDIKNKVIKKGYAEEQLIEMSYDFTMLDFFTELKYAKVGDIVKFGKYYQDNKSISINKSDVEWYVVDVSDDEISLISKKVLLSIGFNKEKFSENNKFVFDYLNDEESFIDDIFTKSMQDILVEDINGYKISLVRDDELYNYVNEVGYKYNCFRNLHTDYINTPPYVITINENKMKNEMSEENYFMFIPDKYDLKNKDIMTITQYYRETDDIKEKLDNYEIFSNNERKKSNRKIGTVGIMPRIIINKKLLDNAKFTIGKEILAEKNELLKELYLQIDNAKCITEYDEDTLIDEMDVVSFGKAPKNKQDNKYEWLILEKKEGKALLLSKYILNAYRYREYYENNDLKKKDLTWEESDVRRELNGWFYKDSFDENEKELIIETDVINIDNKRFNTESGINTKDNIFILSVDECDKYFFNNKMQYKDKKIDNKKLATRKNKKYKDYWVNELYKEPIKDEWFSKNGRFWLRTQGEMWWNVCFVDSNGFVNTRGITTNTSDIGIRPALWVKYK